MKMRTSLRRKEYLAQKSSKKNQSSKTFTRSKLSIGSSDSENASSFLGMITSGNDDERNEEDFNDEIKEYLGGGRRDSKFRKFLT